MSRKDRCSGALISLLLILGLHAGVLGASEVRRGLGPEPDSLHIHKAQGLAAINLLRDLREGLLTFDAGGEPVPGQAESWQLLDEGRRYLFTLRPDARWSDGRQVIAEDFVRAWRLAVSPATAASTAGLLKDILNANEILRGELSADALGVEAVSRLVLEVRLAAPAPWLPEILAHPVSYPLHPEAIDDPHAAPVNGAFVLEDWTPRASIILRKNPGFHAAQSVRIDRVAYFPIEEPGAELSRYRAGELDITETIPAGRFEWLEENLALDLRIYPYLGSFWLGINMKDELLGRSRPLRQALALAIDRAILVRVVLGAGERPAWSIVPPGMPGYEPAMLPAAGLDQKAREAEARRLFAQAGLGDGETVLLELRYNTSALHRRVAVAVAAMWKQVLGVNAQLVNEEWKVFVNNRRLGVVTQVFRGGWIADYADPTSFLDLFLSGSALNSSFYSNPEFDALARSAASAAGAERMELLQRAESLIMQDMPLIPLYYYVSRHLVSPRVGGFVDNVRDVHLSRYLTVETEKP